MSINGLYSGKPVNNTADRLAASATLQLAKEENRPSFELFKRNTCHMHKDLGDIFFLVQLLKSNQMHDIHLLEEIVICRFANHPENPKSPGQKPGGLGNKEEEKQ